MSFYGDLEKARADDPDRPLRPSDPFDDAAELNQRCEKCGHRYGSHGDKGCMFHHARGMLCNCKAFRKGKS